MRVEGELRDLADRVVAADFPFLGACYGTGALGTLGGGVVDRTLRRADRPRPGRAHRRGHRRPAVRRCCLASSTAFLGHKEAVSRLPAAAVRLALSATCPVQAFRFGSHVYATQFHPELDVLELCRRIEAYELHGYYDPPEKESLLATARSGVVTEPPKLLARFVELYAR